MTDAEHAVVLRRLDISDDRQHYIDLYEFESAKVVRDAIERAIALLEREADALKVAVCECLLAINAEDERPIIPPTAIDWIGNRIVSALVGVR